MAMAGSYTSALADLRDTVKWIAAAFTGASAILFSGLAVTNIAQLTEQGHWIPPVALAAVPLIASAWGIAAALGVIKVTPPSTSKLFPRYWKELTGSGSDPLPEPMSLGDEVPTAIAVYGSLKEFDERLVRVLDTVEPLKRVAQAVPTDAGRQAEYSAALTRLDGLQPTVQDALDCAAYVAAKAKFRSAIYQIYAAAGLAVAGLLASGITTGYLARSQNAAAAPVPVSFRVPTAVSVDFAGAAPAKSGGPHRCPLWSGVPAVAVGGTFLDPLLLFSGYSDTDARSHGVTSPIPAGCDQPWLWTAKPGQVLLVPK